MNSYLYRILLISFITLILAQDASAQDDRYRVELIVLKHLNHREAPVEQAWVRDYSAALDFLTPEPEPEEEDLEGIEEENLEPPAADLLAADGELMPDMTGPDPDAVVHVEEMGPEMQDAWRRLRLSGPFRPLQYLGWEQGRNEPFPKLRLHDLEAVYIDDPYADIRAMLESGMDIGIVPTDQPAGGPISGGASPPPQSFQFQTIDPDSIDTIDDGEEQEPQLPDPTLYYALDGTASLVRTRFLHLYLDLELREAVFEPATPAPAGEDAVTSSLVQVRERTEDAPPRPSGYLVHSLLQNRQVKTGRMEYFDGPVISVLAYITAVPLTADEEEPATR